MVEAGLFEPEHQPSRIAGHRVIGELGRGAMASIYLVETESTEAGTSLQALKLIHPHLAEQPEFLDLFSSEARIAARVRHANVVSVHEIGSFSGRPFLCMDYVRGETLFAVLERTWNEDVPLPLLVAAEIVRQTALGLHAAHELEDDDGAPLHVIHRDVGPHNILIGYDGLVRVTDFGVAKALDRTVGTQPGVFRGALPFLSPEQIRGEPLDRRSDLFSLGVVLYEATVGQRLFKHKTTAGTMARILELEIPRPRSLRAEYPPELEAIVLRALERDRTRRHPTAEIFADDLADFLERSTHTKGTELVRGLMAELFQDRLVSRLGLERGGAASLLGPAALPTATHGRQAERLAAEPVTEIVTELLHPAPIEDQAPVLVPPEIGRTPRAGARVGWFPYALASVIGFAVIAVLLIVSDPGSDAPVAVPELPTVRLSFLVEPPEAELLVNGELQDGDLVVPLSPEAYTVEASASGYLPKRMVVSAEASRSIQIQLEPEPPPKKPPKRSRSRRSRRRGR